MKRTSWWVVAAAIAIVAGGCGGPAGLVPVSGKVLYRGDPAAGAVVYFHRQVEPGSSSTPIPYGIVEDDGSYLARRPRAWADGARPGAYTVLVEWRDKR